MFRNLKIPHYHLWRLFMMMNLHCRYLSNCVKFAYKQCTWLTNFHCHSWLDSFVQNFYWSFDISILYFITFNWQKKLKQKPVHFGDKSSFVQPIGMTDMNLLFNQLKSYLYRFECVSDDFFLINGPQPLFFCLCVFKFYIPIVLDSKRKN